MKNKKILWIVLTLAAFCITGCFTTARKPVPARYSFAENENMAAPITFMKGDKVGVRLYDCEGVTMPVSAQGTYWESAVSFPAGKPLNIRVYVYWNEDRYGERRRGIFKCPPLQTGKAYKLWFKGNLKGGALYLTDADVSALILTEGKSKTEIVYQQEIPELKLK
jgi:hypothetical protein